MNYNLKKIILLGFGEQVIDVLKFCKANKIKLSIIAGNRQKNSNNLEIETLRELKKLNFTHIEFVSSLKKSKIFNNLHDTNSLIILSIGSPFIFSKNTINKFSSRIINSHGAPLPEYRGGGGLTWRYLNSDYRGSVLFHEVIESIDTGPIIYSHTFSFPKNKATLFSWYKKQITEDRKGINKLLSKLLNNSINKKKPQRKKYASYFPRINTNINGFINMDWKGDHIERFIGAFSKPYSGATTFVNNTKIKILNCKFIKNKNMSPHPYTNGLIFDIRDNFYFVFVLDGYLKINFSEIISKIKIKLGDRIFTPYHYLNQSMQNRISYNAEGLV